MQNINNKTIKKENYYYIIINNSRIIHFVHLISMINQFALELFILIKRLRFFFTKQETKIKINFNKIDLKRKDTMENKSKQIFFQSKWKEICFNFSFKCVFVFFFCCFLLFIYKCSLYDSIILNVLFYVFLFKLNGVYARKFYLNLKFLFYYKK